MLVKDDHETLIADAWASVTQRQWKTAIAYWRDVCACVPEQPIGWVGIAEGLRELGLHVQAEEAAKAAIERFPDSPAAHIEGAKVAAARKEWVLAAERWAVIRENFPDNPSAYTLGTLPLRRLGKYDTAEQILKAAVQRFPDNGEVLIAYAQLAIERNTWPEALTRCQSLMESHPDTVEGYTGAARALRELDRPREGHDVLVSGLKRFPGNVDILLELARMATFVKKWDVAERRWKEFINKYPRNVQGHAGYGSMLIAQRKSSEAKTYLSKCIERFPDSLDLKLLSARVAIQLGEWEAALAIFRSVLVSNPQNTNALVSCAEVLTELRRYNEADDILNTLLKRGPRRWRMLLAFANVASRKGDWREARERWLVALAEFPDNRQIKRGFSAFTMRMALVDAFQTDNFSAPNYCSHDDHKGPPAAKPDDSTLNDPEVKRMQTIFASFESLGDNCEFGIVQRSLGLEPLGLLRWSMTPVLKLTQALTSNFEGVGDPSNTTLETLHGEFVTFDTRYIMRMHTFINETEISRDELYPQLCKRLKFLKRKLLNDLREGKKYFAYKSTDHISDDEIRRLFEALSNYSENRLFVILKEDEQHPSGSISTLAPRLLVGYIDRFSTTTPNYATWRNLVENAHRAFQSEQAATELENIDAREQSVSSWGE